jgi:hypothetical protein
MTPPVLAFDVELSTPIRSPITAIQDSPGESISRWATSTVRAALACQEVSAAQSFADTAGSSGTMKIP